MTERNANHIIASYCHLSVSCRSLVDRCGSHGSCKPQIYIFFMNGLFGQHCITQNPIHCAAPGKFNYIYPGEFLRFNVSSYSRLCILSKYHGDLDSATYTTIYFSAFLFMNILFSLSQQIDRYYALGNTTLLEKYPTFLFAKTWWISMKRDFFAHQLMASSN